jgi:hypothetical protein
MSAWRSQRFTDSIEISKSAATSARVRSPRRATRTTSRLTSGGNFLGMGTSFPPGHAGRKRCQPNLQQSPELRQRSESLIRGTLVSVSPGPGLGPAGMSSPTVVLAIDVTKVLAGRDPGSTVYVETFCVVCVTSSTAVSGVTVMAYLNRHVVAPNHGLQPTSPDAGRPKGAPLWNPSHPFGLILQDSRGVSVQPLVSRDSMSVGSEPFLPTSSKWPTPSSTTSELPAPDLTPQYPLGSAPASN